MLRITATLEGETQLDRVLGAAATGLKDFHEPLEQSAAELMKSFQMNFDARGGLYGGWAPRKPQFAHGTRIDTWPLLEKTASMRRSFTSEVNGNTAVLGNSASYFKYHQSNQARHRLPRRVMLKIDNATKALIVKAFQMYINKQLKK